LCSKTGKSFRLSNKILVNEQQHPFDFLNDSKEGICKGASMCFLVGPCHVKNSTQHADNLTSSQHRAKNVSSKTMWKHASTNVHEIVASLTFLASWWFNFLQTEMENLIHSTPNVTRGLHGPGGPATTEARKRADLVVPHQKCTTQHAQLHPSLPTPHVNRTALAPNVTPHEHGGWKLANKGFTPDQWCHRGAHLTQLWGATFEKRIGTAVRNLPAEREHWHGNTITRGWTCSATTFFRDAKQHLPFLIPLAILVTGAICFHLSLVDINRTASS